MSSSEELECSSDQLHFLFEEKSREFEKWRNRQDTANLAEVMAVSCPPLIGAVLTVEDPVQQGRLIKRLLSEKVDDVNCKDQLGKTALMHAATLGYRASSQILLNTDGIDLLSEDLVGNTALILAASNNKDEILDLILHKSQQILDTNTLLQYVRHENQLGDTAFTLSLKNGAVNCANLVSNFTALLKEAEESNESMVAKNNGKDPQKGRRKRNSSLTVGAAETLAKSGISLSHYPVPLGGSQATRPCVSQDDLATLTGNLNQVSIANQGELRPYTSKPVQEMLIEKKNVVQKHKVRKVFRVNSQGSPSSDSLDCIVTGRQTVSVGRAGTSKDDSSVESISNRFKSLLNRRKRQRFINTYGAKGRGKTEVEIWKDICEIRRAGTPIVSETVVSNGETVLESWTDTLKFTSPVNQKVESKKPLKLPPLKNEVFRQTSKHFRPSTNSFS